MARLGWLGMSVALGAVLACKGADEMTDSTPPTVQAFSPAEGTAVASGAKVQLTFSEAMSAGTVVVVANDGAADFDLGAPSWDASNVTVSFPSPPAPFAFSTTYTVTVQGDDQGGNPLQGTTSATFTTGAEPAVVAFVPASGTISAKARPKVVFNQRMDEASTAAAFSVVIDGATPTPVACLKAWNAPDDTELSCVPDADLPFSAAVTVTVGASARTALGDALGADAIAHSTVEAAPQPPVVVASTPSNGETNGAPTTSVAITFSKPMDKTSAQGAFSTIPARTCGWGWDAAATTMTCTPTPAFSYGDAVTWTVSTGAKSQDPGGLYMTAPATGGFHVVKKATAVKVYLATAQSGNLYRTSSSTTVALNDSKAGDSAANGTYRTFWSFDLSPAVTGIAPVLTKAVVGASSVQVNAGSPSALAPLYLQGAYYGTLASDDWDAVDLTYCLLKPAPASQEAFFILPKCPRYQWSLGASPSSFQVDVLAKVAEDFANGSRGKLTQFRLKYATDTNSNWVADYVGIYSPYMTVDYEYGW